MVLKDLLFIVESNAIISLYESSSELWSCTKEKFILKDSIRVACDESKKYFNYKVIGILPLREELHVTIYKEKGEKRE